MSRPAVPTGALGPTELIEFARALTESLDRQQDLLDAQLCTRVYEEIWSDDYVNAWVICWADDSDTGFHDHDTSTAAIVVLSGSLREERLALSGPPVTRSFGTGSSFHLPASAIHRVRHAGGPPALTVHAYSPPLRRQGVYRVAPDGALERDSTPYTEELRASVGALGA
jgi:quercetin dioxygenase-like cupin family protein